MDNYLGEIRMVGFNYAPQGWALCNGQLLSIAQNSALFALLGTQFGGDGVQTFGLPNLQGRVPIHQGQGAGLPSYAMGQAGGETQVTLISTQMPMHNHFMNVAATSGGQASPSGGFLAETVDENATTFNTYVASGQNATLNPQSIGFAGGNQPHDNMQPYLCVNFIIALQGVFPPRS